MGSAPQIGVYDDVEMSDGTFLGVTANVYYSEDPSWTEEVMQAYGGMLTWLRYLSVTSEDRTYVLGSKENVDIRCSGEREHFESVEIDGEIVDSSYYTAVSGSTELTILPAFLETLALGEHQITLNYSYGSADAVLTVVESLYIISEEDGVEVTDKFYMIGSEIDATIKCSGALEYFVSVAIDGETVDPSYYKAENGSTVLTILSAFLDQLSVGEHEVTLNYTYGSVDTVLTVIDKQEETTAPTKPAETSGSVQPTASEKSTEPVSQPANVKKSPPDWRKSDGEHLADDTGDFLYRRHGTSGMEKTRKGFIERSCDGTAPTEKF